MRTQPAAQNAEPTPRAPCGAGEFWRRRRQAIPV